MEDSKTQPPLRNHNGISGSIVAGLCLNKHGYSIVKPPTNRHTIRIANLPPFNLSHKSSIESDNTRHSPSDITSKLLFTRNMSTKIQQHQSSQLDSDINTERIATLDSKFPSHKLLDACQNVSFLSILIQSTLHKCLDFCVSDKLQSLMADSLQHSRSFTDKLTMVLHQIDYQMVRQAPKPALEFDLIKAARACINSLRELCTQIKDCLGLLVNILDPKNARYLVMNLHCAAVDLKEAWEIITAQTPPVHILSIHPTLSAPTGLRKNTKHVPYLPRARSASEHQPGTHYIAYLTTSSTKDSTRLFGHLRLAVTGSLHVIDLLNISIKAVTGTESLNQKLYALSQQAQQAIYMALCLAESLDNVMLKESDSYRNNNYDSNSLDVIPVAFSSKEVPTLVSPKDMLVQKDTSRKLWEDTTAYLKSILLVMSSIRSISTEEDFSWPKPIKQGCLHVTRVTAEVAKLWNSYSVFAEHGYYLGKGDGVNRK
ncbi:RAM signaling pathway protein-domain-containing protein [Phycomyces blakesleeanus]|uniref:Uncharacterized protein n=2 Tax=Phycomyces blakesleeanus TaxID=4837 RepID=A0A167MB03_PHYB8|nr:hypothetical protein PHYBLDRAFT_169466 [Phycomyces blakesleeanus NRRL 1555(-)]OAD72327.1 hypothetical protein PHYBLDRAFT_169466 [Phycomyces blakesleeanus NRRL 1555(-)]|eukprot:XP_018290367.1 hypothetical protein PHYBLDRAFT_169466 [Phycomyces blakesleeanus NRRL 1555(-)]